MSKLKDVVEISEKLGIVELVKNKIFGNPEVAMQKVVVALESLTQVLAICETELVRVLTLEFDTKDQISESVKALTEIESGSLSVQTTKARAVVKRVSNIYDRHLRTWFSSILKKDESVLLEELFADISGDEQDYVDLVSELEVEVHKVSREVLDLALRKDYEGAQTAIQAFRTQCLPMRLASSGALRKLFVLEAELIEAMKIA